MTKERYGHLTESTSVVFAELIRLIEVYDPEARNQHQLSRQKLIRKLLDDHSDLAGQRTTLGRNPNSSARHETPLFFAVRHKDWFSIRALLEVGADANACRAHDGYTPLMVACVHQPDTMVILALLNLGGADIMQTGIVNRPDAKTGCGFESALSLAARAGDEGAVQILISQLHKDLGDKAADITPEFLDSLSLALRDISDMAKVDPSNAEKYSIIKKRLSAFMNDHKISPNLNDYSPGPALS